MFHIPRRLLVVLMSASIGLLFLATGTSSHADAQTIPAASASLGSAADSFRSALFSAQAALLGNDEITSSAQIKAAQAIYAQSFQMVLKADAPDIAALLDDELKTASTAAQSGDALGLAAARSTLWADLMHGSSRVVAYALSHSDLNSAQSWLLVREFSTPTKFSRPNANSVLAMNALVAGKSSVTDTLAAVQADLLDTYQTTLNAALVNADNARTQQFSVKTVEQSALAAGYFDLLTDPTLSNVYLTLHGADGLAASRADFAALVKAAVAGDSTGYQAARAQIDTALKGFRAAPLSSADQARRAGQLAQFVKLVSIEYARGVADGKVIKDIEIQEALTFRDGANAAYSDLESILAQRDPTATAQVGTQLAALKTLINSTADPSQVDSTVNDISKTLTTLYPTSWQTINSGSDFDVISSILDQIEPAVQQGLYPQAESARLQAYAVLDSGIEQQLRGFAPDQAQRVESLFWQGDGTQVGLAVLLTSNAPLADVHTGLLAVRAALGDAQTFLGSAKTAPTAVAGNAAIIVFREGLEAILILASLIASMRTDENRRFRRPIFVGAALALGASAITWWIANGLLMSLIQYGEKLSVVVGIIAIAVLLLITNWFFHKTYWTKWMATFHKQKGRIIGGGLVIGPAAGLIILGFTSIYREGFETVLFLQSLVLDAGLAAVLLGVALGLLGTGLVGVAVFALQVRLPAKRLLVVTGVLIGVVLLTMVGTTAHAMQSVGWLPITPITGLYIPYWVGQWFGLFATWQGVGLQFVAGAFVIGSYFLAEYASHRNQTPQPGVTDPAHSVVKSGVPVVRRRTASH